jgi:ATP-dependent helicase/DNAse subunit B
MSAAIEVLLGVAGSGKTARLLERYRSALDEAQREGRAGTTLWLAPSGRARRAVLERLCDGSLPVVFSPNVMTFQDFAGHVLRAAPQSVTPLTPAMQRTLLRRIVERLCKRRELEHFARVAGTSGFLDLVTAFISELKCSETWPEKFTEACTRRGLRPADRELAEIYSEYQAALAKNAVYDSEGQFWSAREALQAGHWGPFGTLSLVVVDGFTDFTHTQHDILALLAERVGRLLVSLPGEWPATRADLFAKSQTVLDGLKSAGRITITHSEPGVETAAEPPPAMRHIARALFSNPRATPRAASAEGVEVVAVAGQQGEVNWIAARIKELLLTGTRPDEIVVAFRGLTDYRDLMRPGNFVGLEAEASSMRTWLSRPMTPNASRASISAATACACRAQCSSQTRGSSPARTADIASWFTSVPRRSSRSTSVPIAASSWLPPRSRAR